MSIFSHVRGRKPRYNTFDLSHDKKMSLNMGELVPIFCAETVPGDTFRMSTSQMLRFAPMIAPVMHRVSVYTHFFFVPNRIIWSNWEKFITGGEDGLDSTVFPFFALQQPLDNGSIGDYFGLPTNQSFVGSVSALPILAYRKIYNEYYRDQNLIDPVVDEAPKDGQISGAVEFCGSKPLKRAWQHDYFTSALPWTQKGPEATIPLAAEFDVKFDINRGTGLSSRVWDPATGQGAGNVGQMGTVNNGWLNEMPNADRSLVIDSSSYLYGEFTDAQATTINELRRAFKLQEWLEKNARGGSRYTETILSHFGVHTGDARLNRPEFLGGGMTPVTISEVLQTSDAAANETPQGNMAGHGISVGKSHSFKYTCKEHGYIIGIMSVMPKTAYQQGVPKHFMKFDKFDYFWPSFANIGEQPILNRELWVDGTEEDQEVFGYIPRYAEYKYMNDTVHGEMRDTLDFWHMGRKFANRPQLNADFIESDPTDRIFAVTDAEKLYAHVFNKVSAKRPMPYYGTPTI